MTTPQENKNIFRNVWESWYRGDQDAIRQYYSPDLVDHEAGPGEPNDLEGFIGRMKIFSDAFSDSRWAVVEQLADEDFLTTRWTLRQKHTGEFMGVLPTGKEIVVTGTSTVRFAYGKVVERWSNAHVLNLMRQLGAVPRSPRPGNVGQSPRAHQIAADVRSEIANLRSSKGGLPEEGARLPDTPQGHKEMFRRVWDDYYNKGDKSTVFKYYDPNVVDHEARPGEAPGLEGMVQNIERVPVDRDAFSETRWRAVFQVAEGDTVATRWEFRRKHTGDFLGVPATGKEVIFTGT